MDPIKKIGIGIFILIIIICIIYFVFLRPTSNDNNSGQGKDKDICARCQPPNTCNKNTGECIPPDTCGGNAKPLDGKDYYCFKGNWTLNTDIKNCKDSYLPLDIGSCSVDQLNCEKSVLYCPKDTTVCNGGDLYFYNEGNEGNKCLNCPTGYNGPNCQFSDKDCKNEGTIKTDGSGKCECKNNTFYGDNCEKQCTGEGKIYDKVSLKCICDSILYNVDGDGCKKKECGNGTLNTTTGKCDCKGGYIGDKCDTLMCNKNQNYNDTTGKCDCKDNIDGSQYYGKDCTEYNCYLATEFKYDETNGPSCDCLVDQGSCGKNCEFTKKNKCNNHGTTNCNSDNDFVNCNCDSGWSGTNCQCKGKKPPITDQMKCLGIDYVCGVSGDWEPTYLNCNDLLSQYNGSDKWSNSCFDKIFDKKDYMVGKISGCEDNTTNKFTTNNCSEKICAQVLGCPTKHPTCDKGKVGLCDESTTYNWNCVDQIHNTGNCPPPPQGTYCIKDDGTPDAPMCFQCGQGGGSEWICQNEGASPSQNCLTGLGITSNLITGLSRPIYTDSQYNNLPIYPTTDRQRCLDILKNDSQGDPFFNGQISNYNVAKLYPNPIGTFDQQSKTFTDLDNTTTRYFNPNTNFNSAKCLLKDEDIVDNILKSTGTLCSGNGTFNQTKDTNGNYLPSGSCACNTGYAGNNCQYSNKTTCNGNGNVTNEGKCNCDSGFAGNTCQFSKNDCNKVGNPYSSNGTTFGCTCDTGYMGNTCQFSNKDCTKTVLPNLNGQASVNTDDKLLCDYSKTCGVPLDYNRYNCRLLIATLKGDDEPRYSGGAYSLSIDSFNNNYVNKINVYDFSIVNTSGFNGIVFTTKQPGSERNGIWNGDNYKINGVSFDGSYNFVGVPATIHDANTNINFSGDQARAFSHYIPIINLADIYNIRVQSKETGNSKMKLYVYLTMETTEGNWQNAYP